MNKKVASTIAFSLGAILLLSLPFTAAYADEIESTISNITQHLVTISIGVALMMYVIAGFLYMAAAGDEKKVSMAKSIITFTTVGLIIILLAEAIVSIVKGFVK